MHGLRIAEPPRTRPQLIPVGRALVILLVSLILAAGVFHNHVFAALGGYLQKSESPRKADLIFVLAGDFWGNRILKAAELVREGYAPKVLVSGPEGLYGFYECDLAISFAEKHGYPADYFLPFPNTALSTREEAAQAIPEMRRLGVKRVMLVTSDYHTRRAGGLFRAAGPDLMFNVVAAPDNYFSPGGWWHNRQGRKIFATEWMKTIAGWLKL